MYLARLETGAGGGFGDDDGTNLKLTNLIIEEANEGKIVVSWQIAGDPAAVRAYQIEQKTKNDSIWHSASGYISNILGQQNYRQQFDHSALSSSNSQLRVRAIGSDGQAIAVSSLVELNSECKSKLTFFIKII